MKTQRQQDTLYNRIQHERAITEQEKDEMVEIFTKGCRANTKYNFRRALGLISLVKPVGILGRVVFNEDETIVQYVAGQSYPDEIRTVREHIMKLGRR